MPRRRPAWACHPVLILFVMSPTAPAAFRTARRVLVLGSSGAGKSTVARELSSRLGLPLVHLDKLHWRPGWVSPPDGEWAGTVRELVKGPAWVIDGNHTGTLPTRLAAADAVVFLDLPRVLCLGRILRRRWRCRGGRTRPEMTPGCPEKIDAEFLRWVLRTYPRDHRPRTLAAVRGASHLKAVAVLESRAAVRSFLAALRPPAG